MDSQLRLHVSAVYHFPNCIIKYNLQAVTGPISPISIFEAKHALPLGKSIVFSLADY